MSLFASSAGYADGILFPFPCTSSTTAARPTPMLGLPCCHTWQYFGSFAPLSSCWFGRNNKCRGNSWDGCFARWSTGTVGTGRWLLEPLFDPWHHCCCYRGSSIPNCSPALCSASYFANTEENCHRPCPEELRRTEITIPRSTQGGGSVRNRTSLSLNRQQNACPCPLSITGCFAELAAEGRTDEALRKGKQSVLGSFFSSAMDSIGVSVKELFWKGCGRVGKQAGTRHCLKEESFWQQRRNDRQFLFLGQLTCLVLWFTWMPMSVLCVSIPAPMSTGLWAAAWVRFLFAGMGPVLQNTLILIHGNSPVAGVETVCVSAPSDMTEFAWSRRIIFRHLLLAEQAASPTDQISAFGSSFIMLSKVSSCIIV